MAEFLANPGGDRWKDPQFEHKLQKRLGSAYDAYIDIMRELRTSIDNFRQTLKLDLDGKPRFSDENKFRLYYKTLKFSLKKADYDNSMTAIRRANTSLDRITSQRISLQNLETMYNSKRHPKPKFSTIHKHARGFHDALQFGWKCSCRTKHRVHLRLEHRIDDEDNGQDDDDDAMNEPFHVIFQYDNPEMVSHSSPSPIVVSDAWSWKEADVRVTLKEPSLGIKTAGKKSVHFTRQSRQAVQAVLAQNRNIEPIHCLCAAISSLQDPWKSVHLSILADESTKTKHGIAISSPQNLLIKGNDQVIRALPGVLDDTLFSRRHRIQLAVTLASSILQLHETAWLRDNWTTSDILFLEQSGETIYTDPFVHRVVDPSSKEALPPIMRYIIRNQVLYTLGISLIELWFKKSISTLHEPQDGPIGTGDAQTTLLTQIATANRLIEGDLRDDAGGNYADAVRRCINCDFDCRLKKLEDESFQKAVFEGVVTPIKETFDFMYRTI